MKTVRPGAVLLSVLAAALLGGCSSSTTYGTGERPETAILHELTGSIGLGGTKKEPIEYKPRSPLVKPPSSALPPPEVGTVDATAWPDDPDRRRAHRGPRDAFAGLTPAERRAKEREILAMPRPDTPSTIGGPGAGDGRLSAAEERRQAAEFRKKVAEMNGADGKRRYLTEPPERYREPIGGAAAVSPAEPKKKPGFFSRLFGRSDG